MDVLVATDFFTAAFWTLGGLVTYDVLFFVHLGSRKVHIAGVTPHPNQAWIMQIARNVTMAQWGFLSAGQYLIHDRDGKYGPAFQQLIEAAGLVTREKRGQFVHYRLVEDNLANTLNGYLQEVCPVSRPLKRESKARGKAGKD